MPKCFPQQLCQFTLIPVMYESAYFPKTWLNYIFQCFDLCRFDRWKIIIHGTLAFLMKYTEHLIIVLKRKLNLLFCDLSTFFVNFSIWWSSSSWLISKPYSSINRKLALCHTCCKSSSQYVSWLLILLIVIFLYRKF